MIYQNHTSKHGFALMLTMLIITLIVSITTYVAYRTTMFIPYTKIAIEQQKARQLALSGIQLAISRLSTIKKPESSDPQKQNQKIDETYIAKQLLTTVLPNIHQWKSVRLRKSSDGIDGIIQFCISSEHGKININTLYDFENHRFIDEKDQKDAQPVNDKKENLRSFFKNIFEYIQKNMGGTNLFESFEKFLKQRQYRLDDVTELLAAPGFEIFRNYIFYVPPTPTKENTPEWRPFFLTDLFTIDSGHKEIEPWLLSDSVRGSFGFKRVTQELAEKKENASTMIQEALNSFTLTTDWKKSWNQLLTPFYQTEYNALIPSLTTYLSTKFESTVFSVVSYGTFARITQRLYALLERTVEKNGDDVVIQVKIKKIYWL